MSGDNPTRRQFLTGAAATGLGLATGLFSEAAGSEFVDGVTPTVELAQAQLNNGGIISTAKELFALPLSALPEALSPYSVEDQENLHERMETIVNSGGLAGQMRNLTRQIMRGEAGRVDDDRIERGVDNPGLAEVFKDFRSAINDGINPEEAQEELSVKIDEWKENYLNGLDKVFEGLTPDAPSVTIKAEASGTSGPSGLNGMV